jgi:GPH family glycoside/pentoside/hexuronide:cation symporter
VTRDAPPAASQGDAAPDTKVSGAVSVQAPAPLSVTRKVLFGLGDHTINVSLGALSLVFFTFLVTVAGLQPWLAGILAWLARLVDAITDPLMGRISDHTRWRAGRRRPYFLLGMLPFGLFFALIWQTPFTGQAEMFAYYLTVYIGLCLSMTVLSVPYMALIPDMAVDYDERTSLNTFRSGAAVMGTMVAAAFFGLAEALGGGAAGYSSAGLMVAVWVILPWPIVHRVSFEPKAAEPESEHGLLEGIASLARHGNYVRLCGLFLTARIAVDLLGLAIPLFIAVWIGRKEDIHWVLLSMLSVVVISLPFWLRFARHLEKNRIFMIGAVWFVVFLVGIFFVDGTMPRWPLFVVSSLVGIGYAVVDLMPWAMLGEVIDEDELLAGERREGVYTGVFTFLRKVGGATAYMMAGFALSLAGYDSEASQQPESALLCIRVLATLVPALFLIFAFLIAIGYPLGRRRHGEILSQLDVKRRTA